MNKNKLIGVVILLVFTCSANAAGEIFNQRLQSLIDAKINYIYNIKSSSDEVVGNIMSRYTFAYVSMSELMRPLKELVKKNKIHCDSALSTYGLYYSKTMEYPYKILDDADENLKDYKEITSYCAKK